VRTVAPKLFCASTYPDTFQRLPPKSVAIISVYLQNLAVDGDFKLSETAFSAHIFALVDELPEDPHAERISDKRITTIQI
jgi:hypothetical protein